MPAMDTTKDITQAAIMIIRGGIGRSARARAERRLRHTLTITLSCLRGAKHPLYAVILSERSESKDLAACGEVASSASAGGKRDTTAIGRPFDCAQGDRYFSFSLARNRCTAIGKTLRLRSG